MSEIRLEYPGNARIEGTSGSVADNITIGEGSSILGESVEIGQGVRIGRNVLIKAKHIKIGFNTTIGDNVVCDYGGKAENLEIGDLTEMGEGVKIRVPYLVIGDYGRIHPEVVFYGQKKCLVGHNCWIGQWSILNSKDDLIIGNNFRTGVQSQIWTHVASGEFIEGCTMYKVAPTYIDDDVWLVGHSIISPGIHIRKKSTILPGAILSKDTEEGRCYAGIPATDITEKYNPYKPITLDEKYEMMKQFVAQFLSNNPGYTDHVFLEKYPEDVPMDSVPESGAIIILKDAKGEFSLKENTVFDIMTKKYGKRLSGIEMDFIKANLGHNARFVPANQ